ncbi:hypothetical protein NP233_g3607 [Leucocoprinus birnbaumii]|uniref:WD40 repeat-like protein n=1 Tax=Leucocoprinus birnbaumii TaxID=56174 RepID=A0AAD5VW82_9AGAR|nr:hypothetical protein NP233_g3607 [Leucocoprinus birnbaumii]
MEESLSLYEAPGPQVSVTLGYGDAYVLSLANLPSSYAASASYPSNRIDLLDKQSLRRIQTLPGHELATTSIRAVNNVVGMPSRALISSGKDGSVKIWDERTGSHAIKYGGLVAAGSEIQSDDAFVMYWDPRQPAAPLHTHSSTHSEDITTISFHPSASSPPLVLSGSSDGLLSISNATEPDEDEAVLQVGSWGASVSQAGWYLPDANSTTFGVWAASDMETFSLWSDELDQRLSLDIRSPSVHTQSRTWVTDYLISCVPSAHGGLRVYTGSNEGDAVLITPPALSSLDPLVNSIKNWTLHSLWQGHHAGIVRSILPDDENDVIITGGEDGKIHLWMNDSSMETQNSMDVDEDVEMNTTPRNPVSPSRKKRDRDDDEILTITIGLKPVHTIIADALTGRRGMGYLSPTRRPKGSQKVIIPDDPALASTRTSSHSNKLTIFDPFSFRRHVRSKQVDFPHFILLSYYVTCPVSRPSTLLLTPTKWSPFNNLSSLNEINQGHIMPRLFENVPNGSIG